MELRIRERREHHGEEKEEGIEAEAVNALIYLQYVVTITLILVCVYIYMHAHTHIIVHTHMYALYIYSITGRRRVCHPRISGPGVRTRC